MILGILSIVLDLLILNIIGTNIIFPMFSFVFLIRSIYLKIDIKRIIIIYIIYSCIIGIFYLPLLLLFLNYIFNNISYYKRIILSLVIYDLLFFLFIGLTNINFFVYKLVITLPINLIYSFFVLKIYKNKYKLV